MKRWILAVLLYALMHQSWALCISPLCSCNVSTTPILFGSFDPLPGTARTANGTVTLACSGAAGLLIPYSIAISSGSGTVMDRKMVNGARNLFYNIHADGSYTTIWGDGTLGAPAATGSILLNVLGTLSLQYTMFGRIVVGQRTLVPGTYTDRLTVTVTYE